MSFINEVTEAIAKKLGTEYPGLPIYRENLENGLDTPCFFIELLTSSQNSYASRGYTLVNDFEIHYIPSVYDSREERITRGERLYDVLETVETDKGLKLRGRNMSFIAQEDGVLHFKVTYSIREYKTEDSMLMRSQSLTQTVKTF